jgi:hypothetical protein
VLACGFLTRHARPPDDEQIKATVLGIADESTRVFAAGSREQTNLTLLPDERETPPSAWTELADSGGPLRGSLIDFGGGDYWRGHRAGGVGTCGWRRRS